MLARFQTYAPTALLAVLIAYFAFQAFTGERGLLMREQRDATLAARQVELKRLEAQRNDLEVRAQLLRDTSLSADLLEERASSLLGYVGPRDYVIRTSR